MIPASWDPGAFPSTQAQPLPPPTRLGGRRGDELDQRSADPGSREAPYTTGKGRPAARVACHKANNPRVPRRWGAPTGPSDLYHPGGPSPRSSRLFLPKPHAPSSHSALARSGIPLTYHAVCGRELQGREHTRPAAAAPGESGLAAWTTVGAGPPTARPVAPSPRLSVAGVPRPGPPPEGRAAPRSPPTPR